MMALIKLNKLDEAFRHSQNTSLILIRKAHWQHPKADALNHRYIDYQTNLSNIAGDTHLNTATKSNGLLFNNKPHLFAGDPGNVAEKNKSFVAFLKSEFPEDWKTLIVGYSQDLLLEPTKPLLDGGSDTHTNETCLGNISTTGNFYKKNNELRCEVTIRNIPLQPNPDTDMGSHKYTIPGSIKFTYTRKNGKWVLQESLKASNELIAALYLRNNDMSIISENGNYNETSKQLAKKAIAYAEAVENENIFERAFIATYIPGPRTFDGAYLTKTKMAWLKFFGLNPICTDPIKNKTDLTTWQIILRNLIGWQKAAPTEHKVINGLKLLPLFLIRLALVPLTFMGNLLKLPLLLLKTTELAFNRLEEKLFNIHVDHNRSNLIRNLAEAGIYLCQIMIRYTRFLHHIVRAVVSPIEGIRHSWREGYRWAGGGHAGRFIGGLLAFSSVVVSAASAILLWPITLKAIFSHLPKLASTLSHSSQWLQNALQAVGSAIQKALDFIPASASQLVGLATIGIGAVVVVGTALKSVVGRLTRWWENRAKPKPAAKIQVNDAPRPENQSALTMPRPSTGLTSTALATVALAQSQPVAPAVPTITVTATSEPLASEPHENTRQFRFLSNLPPTATAPTVQPTSENGHGTSFQSIQH